MTRTDTRRACTRESASSVASALSTLLVAAAFATAPTIASGQGRDEAHLQAAGAEQAAVVKTLETLVGIETGTGDAEGLAAARLDPAPPVPLGPAHHGARRGPLSAAPS